VDPQQFLARLKALANTWSPSQMATLGVAFAAVVAIVAGSAVWRSTTSYELLYADMDRQAASEIVAALKAQKMPYQLDSGGRAVRVPADKVDQLRLDIAGRMPSSGRIGFEIFDRTAFGATEFVKQINYQRALEGEIARTISATCDVAGARVHIAPAKTSSRGERQPPARATVLLKLKRPLPASTINGIRRLLAGSVEGLRTEAVTVVDSFGRPLTPPA
jgi:flagellar M-ring protein FliF